MNIGASKQEKLQKIGEIRWWSKQAALKRTLGTYEDPEKGTFIVLIIVLQYIQQSPFPLKSYS